MIIIFGTDHYGSDILTLTSQNYSTPFGMLQTDHQLIYTLTQKFTHKKIFHGELRHRTEHSIELAATWLQYICIGSTKDHYPPIFPILTGDFLNLNEQDKEYLEQFISALREVTRGKKVVFVAAADLAHIGTVFGDIPVDINRKARLRKTDEELLEIICSGDADKFLESIRNVKNKNNICGVGPIYITLRMIQPTKGKIIAYDQCSADDQGTSIVSICGAIFNN